MQTNSAPEIYITEDGSPTLWASAFGEHYHSTHGAVQESMYIFLERALGARAALGIPSSRPLQVFEVGFGTGLNALLSALWAERHHIPLIYTSIERYPISRDVYESLHFPLPKAALQHHGRYPRLTNEAQQEVTYTYDRSWQNQRQVETTAIRHQDPPQAVSHLCPRLSTSAPDQLLQELHQAPWDRTITISSYFHIHKIEGDLLTATLPLGIDVVYFDAFSPESQPELWSEEIFGSIYQASRAGAVLSTYCAKGEVRRRLQRVGYSVSRLPGPPGKREILSAHK